MAKGRRVAKYAITAIIALLGVWIAVNGTLFVTGLTGIQIPPGQSQGSVITLTLAVPNHSYIPIQGRIVTSVYDAVTGSQIGSGDDSFSLPPGAASPITIRVKVSQTTANPVRVTMDYYIGLYGLNLPFSIRGADVTMQPIAG